MSATFALPTKQKATKRVNFSQLFDWAAEHLRLATPVHVVDALMDADGRDYIKAFGSYIPRAHTATFTAFKRMRADERLACARAWFDNIEPGHMQFRDPPF